MGTSTIIAGLQMESEHVVNGATDTTIIEKRTFGRKLLMALDDHTAAENGINSNESLSQQGKLEALKKLGTETTAPALKWMKNVIKEKQEKDQRYRTQFFTITSGIDNAVERMLKYSYLWSKLDLLDQTARVTQFLQAAEQDQVVILSAMLENPFGPMVDKEVKERALTERAKRLTPNDYQNFEQNQILLEFLTMSRDWIARTLALEVGVEIPVIRTNFGDEIADALTGLPQLAGV